MIQHELLRDKGILIITPQGPLEQKDFNKGVSMRQCPLHRRLVKPPLDALHTSPD
jgi:hypothetical protein